MSVLRKVIEALFEEGRTRCPRCADIGIEPLADTQFAPCQACSFGVSVNRQLESMFHRAIMPRVFRLQPYEEYLSSNEWRVRREEAIARAGGCCQLCNSNNALQVHHRTYERMAEELPGDLIVLCRECHAKFHDKIPRKTL